MALGAPEQCVKIFFSFFWRWGERSTGEKVRGKFSDFQKLTLQVFSSMLRLILIKVCFVLYPWLIIAS